jgi:hypothetical protein
VAFDGRQWGDEDLRGKEELPLWFAGRNESNSGVDEFSLTEDLNTLADTWGMRLERFKTYPVEPGLDLDGKFAVIYETNLTRGNVDIRPQYTTAPLAGNPENPTNPDKQSLISYPVGYRVWQDGLDTSKVYDLKASALALQAGEYITGVKVVYGAVAEGFYVGHYQPLTGQNPGTLDNPGGMAPGQFKDTSDGTKSSGLNPSHNWRDYDELPNEVFGDKVFPFQAYTHKVDPIYNGQVYNPDIYTTRESLTMRGTTDGGLHNEQYNPTLFLTCVKSWNNIDDAGNHQVATQTVHAEVSKNASESLTKHADATSDTTFFSGFRIWTKNYEDDVADTSIYGSEDGAVQTAANAKSPLYSLITMAVIMMALAAATGAVAYTKKRKGGSKK